MHVYKSNFYIYNKYQNAVRWLKYNTCLINNLIQLEFIRNPGTHDALRTIASTSYLRRIIVKASVSRIKYHMFHNSKSE